MLTRIVQAAKGAMLTNRNLIANMQQASAWLSTSGIEPGKEVIITALPLYHIFALTANGLVFMKFGGCNHLITNPRDMKGFVKELKGTRFTAITGVNTLFNGLLNTPGFDEIDFSSVKFTLGGGMAVQRAVAERWKKVTGVTLVEAYGLTETSPAACINPLTLPEYNGAIGLPIPSTDACIKDDNGNILALGEVGELCIKGPQVMKGYWAKEQLTAETLKGGWLHTGDVGGVDAQGFFKITDRMKDIIITAGGKNITPSEWENELKFSPYVTDAVVIGDKRRYLTVIIMIDQENVEKYAQDNDVPFSNYASLTHSAEVQNLIQAEVDRVNKKFARVEQIKKFWLLDTQLSAEDEELTPTMKLKRKLVEKKYAPQIEAMYR